MADVKTETDTLGLPPDLWKQLTDARIAYSWALELAAAYWTERLGEVEGDLARLGGSRHALEIKIAAGRRFLDASAALVPPETPNA